jgi:hypothetical protein
MTHAARVSGRMSQFSASGLRVAAADAREASARHAARSGELTARSTTDAGHTALAARPAAGSTVLATGSAGAAVGGTAAAARVLLEDGVGGRAD